MSRIKDLTLAVFKEDISVEDLTDEEQEGVIVAMREIAEALLDDPETEEMALKMFEAMDGLEDGGGIIVQMDPFSDAISEAENRGVIYIDSDNDSLH